MDSVHLELRWDINKPTGLNRALQAMETPRTPPLAGVIGVAAQARSALPATIAEATSGSIVMCQSVRLWDNVPAAHGHSEAAPVALRGSRPRRQ